MGQNQVKEKDSQESTPILLEETNLKEKSGMDTEFLLHRVAYLGDLEKVKSILKKDERTGESIVRKLDNIQMTPLHNAALGGSSKSDEIAKLLLNYDAKDETSIGKESLVNLQDSKGKTALHYAAAKQPDLINVLKNFNADPNVQDNEGCTPLHICTKGNSEAAVDCIKLLLNFPTIRKYETCGPNNNNQSALHLAAGAMAHKMVNHLLNNGFDHSKPDTEGYTPLHLAASAGDTPEAVGCVKELLRVSNVDEVNAITGEKGQSALHIAALKCHHKVLAALLEELKTDIWVTDNEYRTALHWAAEAWFKTNSLACVKLLIESPKISDWHDKAVFLYGKKDKKGETAMDIAIKYKCIRIAEYLIQAHPSPEAWLEDSMLERIYETLPEAMIPLMNNKGLTYNPARFHERNESIDAEFGPITGYDDPVEGEKQRQESKYLHKILYAPQEIQRTVLLHPLVQIFIDLKWKKIRPITWMAIGFQFVWLILYTTLVFEIYVPDCPHDNPDNATVTAAGGENDKKAKNLKILLSLGFATKEHTNLADCDFLVGPAATIAAILFLMSGIIVVKEIFQMKNNSHYIRDAANWGQWTLMIVFVVNTIPAFQSQPEIHKWQSYLAAFGVFLAWVLSLREIGKFPNCGIYAAILKKVFWHCLKMLIFYFPLLVAFAVCLRILLPGKGQYTYFLFAIIKVVIMMTGELDFDESFYTDEGPNLALNAIFSQLVFLLLVFITTIVLLNLLTGLAVNDVQSLIEEAEINRLSNELEQIYLLESLILFLRKSFGFEKGVNYLQKLNVTTTVYPDYVCFTSKISDVGTKNYTQDLKRRIKDSMVPEEDD